MPGRSWPSRCTSSRHPIAAPCIPSGLGSGVPALPGRSEVQRHGVLAMQASPVLAQLAAWARAARLALASLENRVFLPSSHRNRREQQQQGSGTEAEEAGAGAGGWPSSVPSAAGGGNWAACGRAIPGLLPAPGGDAAASPQPLQCVCVCVRVRVPPVHAAGPPPAPSAARPGTGGLVQTSPRWAARGLIPRRGQLNP